MTENAKNAFATIRTMIPHAKARIGIILGSGLGNFIEILQNTKVIAYRDLPGFPIPSIKGHEGQFVFGELSGQTVICLQGRAHAYEGESQEAVKTYVRTLKLLGVEILIATNAAGSLNVDMPPGELLLVHDHINLQPNNPLVGPNDEAFGPRFYPLDQAYDLHLREKFLAIAKKEAITLREGVYIAVLGPNYETAAEIRAFKMLGADAVGMSTVPEVLVAKHCGMNVAVISILSNYATGIASVSHDHDAVLQIASASSLKLRRLIQKFIADEMQG